jgi:hypothetical protein
MNVTTAKSIRTYRPGNSNIYPFFVLFWTLEIWQETKYNLLPRTISNQPSKHFHGMWVTVAGLNADITATLCRWWKTREMHVTVLNVRHWSLSETVHFQPLCTLSSLILPSFTSRIRHYRPFRLYKLHATLTLSRRKWSRTRNAIIKPHAICIRW